MVKLACPYHQSSKFQPLGFPKRKKTGRGYVSPATFLSGFVQLIGPRVARAHAIIESSEGAYSSQRRSVG